MFACFRHVVHFAFDPGHFGIPCDPGIAFDACNGSLDGMSECQPVMHFIKYVFTASPKHAPPTDPLIPENQMMHTAIGLSNFLARPSRSIHHCQGTEVAARQTSQHDKRKEHPITSDEWCIW